MKILVYGSGVIGSYLTHVLCAAGNYVTVLARGKWKEQLERNGLKIRHHLQREETLDHPKVIGDIKEDDRYDAVFAVMPYSKIGSILDQLAAVNAPLVTLVGNNMSPVAMQQTILEKTVCDKQVLFGFQATAGKRDKENGMLICERAGAGMMDIGGLHSEPDPQTKVKLALIFSGTGYKLNWQPNMEAYLICHLAAIMPIGYLAYACGGDVRKAINAVELSTISSPLVENKREISLDTVISLTQKSAVKYDKEGDEHYDLLSAFQKSMRGSDPDAAVHYLARILEADDLPSACRRLMVCACEDVGLANPQIIPIVKAAVDAAMMVGLPEARIPLADAVILVALSPKSNSAYMAIDNAIADVRAGKGGGFPRHLQNKHYDGADAKVKGQFYLYPHDYPNHWTDQQYLPDNLKGTVYYEAGMNKNEQAYRDYWQKIKNKK